MIHEYVIIEMLKYSVIKMVNNLQENVFSLSIYISYFMKTVEAQMDWWSKELESFRNNLRGKKMILVGGPIHPCLVDKRKVRQMAESTVHRSDNKNVTCNKFVIYNCCRQEQVSRLMAFLCRHRTHRYQVIYLTKSIRLWKK